MTAVDRVHAAEDHVAARHGTDGVLIEKVSWMAFDDGAEAHVADGARGDIDLESATLRVFHRGVQNSIEVFLFDAIRVHQH